MADGFRRMIEKKMSEMVKKEMAKSKDADEVLRIEVERRTTIREKEINAEKERFIKEHEIKLLTAQEARQDAEEMARRNTVESMVQAAA